MKRSIAAFALFGLFALTAFAQQTYPSRPIRVVVPYPPGGSGDVVARTIGAKLTEAWRQQVLVDNKPGAGGNIGSEFVARAAADGYTLLLGTDIQMAINPHVYRALPYDPERDFAPVVLGAFVEFVLSVHPSVPAANLAELIAHVKANPGKYSYASSGIGSTHHLSMEWIKSMTGMSIVHVPYKGSGQVIPDLIAGQVQLSYAGIPQTMPHVQGGRLKAIAIGASRRLDAAPGVPTVGETLPGFEANAWWSFFAPAGTPPDLVAKLNGEINRILLFPEIQERFASQGLFPIGGAPDKLAARMKSDREKWGKVIREIGLRAE